MSDQDYTIDDIARILQIHRKTAERLVTSGKLRAYKVGRIHRITPESLETFRKENRVRPQEKGKGDLLLAR